MKRILLFAAILLPTIAFGRMEEIQLTVSGVTTDNVPETVTSAGPITGKIKAVHVSSDTNEVVWSLATVAAGSGLAQTIIADTATTAHEAKVYYPTVVENVNTSGDARTATKEIVLRSEKVILSVTGCTDDTTNSVTARIIFER